MSRASELHVGIDLGTTNSVITYLRDGRPVPIAIDGDAIIPSVVYVDKDGGFVRGLSMRDVESLCEEAGLGKTSRSSVSRVCAELHERFEAFCRRSLYYVNLVVLFLDAIYLPVRPSGPKEGVICAWGITENGDRALVSVRLGMRETKEDWLDLGRGPTSP